MVIEGDPPEVNLGMSETQRKVRAWRKKINAAAPDMLAALKAVEAHHVKLNAKVGRPESHSRTLMLVRAAIAKAEGRTP